MNEEDKEAQETKESKSAKDLPEEEQGPSYDDLKKELGQAITKVREENGRNIEDIAYQINIPVPNMKKMEDGSAYDSMERVFLRGYLINFTRVLDIDSAPFLELLNEVYRLRDGDQPLENKKQKPPHTTYSVQQLDQPSNNPWLKFVVPLVIILAIVSSLIYWRFIEVPIEVNIEADDEYINLLPDILDEEEAPVIKEIEEIEPAKGIEFTFLGESWLAVTDSSGKEIAWQLYGPGQSVSFTGEPPYQIVVGNAPKTLIKYGGQSIDINQYTDEDNVARFSLPR